jgi:hypothetical protein
MASILVGAVVGEGQQESSLIITNINLAIMSRRHEIEAKRYKSNPIQHLAKSIYILTTLYNIYINQSYFLPMVGPALKPLIRSLDMRLAGAWLLAPADLVLT